MAVKDGARFIFWWRAKGAVSFTPPTPPPFGGNLLWPTSVMLRWPGDNDIGWPGL